MQPVTMNVNQAIPAVLPLSSPEPVTDPKNETLLDAICKHLEQYVFIKNRKLFRLIALWVIATYLHEEFEYMGYLFIHSPEMGSGKTTLLTHLNLLVNRSTGVTCSPTEAVLFRTAKGHTLLLDEGDGWDNARSLRRVLNTGFHRDGMVQRCESVAGSSEFNVKNFPTYSPKALAGIGKDILTETTRSRTFMIEMLRKTNAERTRRRRGLVPGAAELKQQIETWCRKHKAEVTELYTSLADETFPYLSQFGSRTQDIAEPLAVILEVMLANSPNLSNARLELLDAIAATRNESNGLSEQLQVLVALERVMGEGSVLEENPMTLGKLIDNGNGESQVSEETISETLRTFGFEQKMVRKEGVGPRRCYVIERAHLKEMIARYAVAANPELGVM